MKRLRLHKWEQDIIFYVSITLFCISFLTFEGNEISWSENALRVLNSMLNAALGGIMATFIIVQYNHPDIDKIVFKWLATELRLKHFSSIIAKGFYAILIFSLNTDLLPEWLHMVATGISVVALVFLVSGWYDTWTFKWWIFTGWMVLSGIALAIAFIYRTIDVKHPEFALAIGGLAFLAAIRKKRD